MTSFLAAIGEKLADKWAALLVIPGLVYISAATVSAVLGQRNAVSFNVLSDQIGKWADSPAWHSVGVAVLFVAGIIAGSALAGFAAVAGGRLTETLWTMPGRRRPARWLASSRRRRWWAAKTIADNSLDPAESRAAMKRADRICLVDADRPTWIGDRLRACRVRVDRTYGLDLDVTWPRLWLILPDLPRADLAAARDSFNSAARLTAWSVLYLLLGIWWWPAALIGIVTLVAGSINARVAVANLTELVEAAVDLYGHDLAGQLGKPASPSVTPNEGRQLTTIMRKSVWEPGSPLAD